MKRIFIGAVAGLMLTGCGGKKSDVVDHKVVEEASYELNDAISRGDAARASQMADSMALYVDDLTPDETVYVLLAFLNAHNAGNGRDLETQRKYVDVYDIAVSNDRAGMEKAFDKARRRNSELDFRKAYSDFRSNLAEYDAVKTYGRTPVAEPDSVEAAPADSIVNPIN